MGNIKDYFSNVSNFEMTVTQSQELTITNEFDASIDIKIPAKMFLDFQSGSIYLAFYIPVVKKPLGVCADILNSDVIEKILKCTGGFRYSTEFPKTYLELDAAKLKFCGRVFIYSDNDLNPEEIIALQNKGKEQDILATYYGPQWAKESAALDKPLAFISHDSRDKDGTVNSLVEELSKFPRCTIWYDEYSLKAGDSLRESIERGIKESKKCILVLTPNFLSNKSWAKNEFDSIYMKELIEKSNAIIPVWRDVSKEDIYSYSPSLANKVAVIWERDVGKVAQKLYKSLID